MGGEDSEGHTGGEMSEKKPQIPLGIFGPKMFYWWLVEHWENLTNESRKAIQANFVSLEAGVQNLLTKLPMVEYEKALSSLTDEDFENFVNWALEQNNPLGIPLNLSDLGKGRNELRQLLALEFPKERAWPRYGLQTLVVEGLKAANQAVEALSAIGYSITSPYRLQAIKRVHEGMDKALLCAERFLDLLLEFFVLVALKVGHIDEKDAGKIIKAIGVSSLRKTHSLSWSDKELLLGIIHKEDEVRLKSVKKFKKLKRYSFVTTFLEDSVPPDSLWEPVWHYLRQLTRSCELVVLEEDNDIIQIKPAEDAKLIKCLVKLRELRNRIRHASYSPSEIENVPEDYIKAAPRIRKLLQNLRRATRLNSSIPQLAKVSVFRQNYYGVFDITLALETKEYITARYVHPVHQKALAADVEESLALTQEEYEFFLIPSPLPDRQTLLNPLLLRRYNPEQFGWIKVKDEVLIEFEKKQIESKKAPLEERIEEESI